MNEIMKESLLGSKLYELAKEKGFNILSKPTQSLLQKWLRENHKLFVSVNCCSYDEPERFSATLSGYDKKGIFMPVFVDGFTIYNSYEEALEEGLEEALNWI